MTMYHWIFMIVLILAGATFSNSIKKYLTFLPSY